MKRLARCWGWGWGLCILLATAPARAYRPFDSTDASVAERGELELEVGPVGYLRANRKSAFAPMEVLNLGVVDRWELVLQGREVVPSPAPSPSSRLSLVDTAALLKCVLRPGSLQARSGASVATEFGALLPTVNGDPGAGFSGSLLVSHRFSAATLHFNVQGVRTRASNADLFVGAIAEGPHDWHVRPVAELFFEREFDTHTALSALVGFIAPVSDHFALDAGARLASMDGQEVFEARAGFTWALPVLR